MLQNDQNTAYRMYPAGIVFGFVQDMLDHLPDMLDARRSKRIKPAFSERIMLAVTEVNGCRYCSYAHTRMALEAGMTDREIKAMLAGVHDDVPQEEIAAICFAQHYAESQGKPDAAAVDDLVNRYGKAKARDILAYIRAIMVGNTLGSALDGFLSRLKGKPFENSNWFNEILILTGIIFLIPYFLVRLLIMQLLGRKKN